MALTRRGFISSTVTAAFTNAAISATRRKPNVVLIFCDDLGYGDLGCYGSQIPTPNLDRLASEGSRFTQFYSANPVCSPSRASLLTGRYPTRVGVPHVLFPYSTTGLNAGEVTIAQMLKAQDYATACIGKWHLGHRPEHLPMRWGFDSYFGIPYSNDMAPRLLMRNEAIVEQTATLETLTRRYTDEAIKFIGENKSKPFFLYMPHTYPHIPLGASAKFRGTTPQGLYGDVVAELDASVGEVLSELKRHGLENDTLVLFTSDNGPWYQGSAGQLRGRKGSTYEGGVREPFLARLPGRIPKGLICDGVASTLDLLPSIAALCGATLPERPLDGIDIWPMLEGKKPEIEREALLYFDGWDVQCVRRGQWKLHFARHNGALYQPAPAGGRVNLRIKSELYDLRHDPQESYDVAPDHPDVVRDLEGRLERLLQSFPEPVKSAYAKTLAQTAVPTPTGAVPRAAPK